MSTESPMSTVIVVGGGIIGPVVALLLKQKGHHPIIVEKVTDIRESGLAIAIHPNGQTQSPNRAGVADDLLQGTVPWEVWDEYTPEGDFLGGSHLMKTLPEHYGWSCVGISRTRIQLCRKGIALKHGIEFHQGWKLSDIRQTSRGVVADAEDGREIGGQFLVGCDGIKSRTREVLLEKNGVEVQEPDYTGIAVLGGVSPTPPFLKDGQGVNNWYGSTITMISHPLENGTSVWGIKYLEENKVLESWRTLPSDELPQHKQRYLEQFHDWPETIHQLINDSQKMMKIGLHDRPELPPEHWFHGRCVLLGDAAHPGTPHIGQGANQGLEDCYHFAQLLPDFNAASPSSLTTENLESIFLKFAEMRQPRTAQLVKMARTQGKLRAPGEGPNACKERDEKVRQIWADQEVLQAAYDGMYQEPFVDTEKIRACG